MCNFLFELCIGEKFEYENSLYEKISEYDIRNLKTGNIDTILLDDITVKRVGEAAMIEDRFIKMLQSLLCKQVNAALLYSKMLPLRDEINWLKVNQAIIDKWSESSLKKVKTMAWQLIEGSHLRFESNERNTRA